MAAATYFSNRGKYLLATGAIAGASDIYMGAINASTVPAAMDTEAEIQDLNTVAELLALTSVDEVTGGSYARVAMTNVAATEDDTNNRVNLDADNVTFEGVASGQNVICGWIHKDGGGDDSTHELIAVWILASNIPGNGSDIEITVSDFARLS